MIRYSLDYDESYEGGMECLGLSEHPQGEYVLHSDHLEATKTMEDLLEYYFLHGDSGRFYDRVKDFMKDRPVRQ